MQVKQFAADFSKGDESKFGHNAREQCMVMALTSFSCI